MEKIGLNLSTELLIKQSNAGACGVDLPEPKWLPLRTNCQSREKIGLPELSEPTVIRHFVRLSTKNYSIDGGFYPLGSCTMKHNPRINEKLARLAGFADIHPLQDESTVQGALELMYQLQHYLSELVGLPAISLTPAAGSHGELAGMMVIKRAILAKKEIRDIVIIPESAHGTNPATAAICGFTIVSIKTNSSGDTDMSQLIEAVEQYGTRIAGIMLTNPSTCGRFEPNVKKIADLIHGVGGYFYCDGANFNAIVGRIRPADFGVDVMHFNLHKTFSTPHGGGGPGSGPIATTDELAPFLPNPRVAQNKDGSYSFVNSAESLGKVKGFCGQFGMMVRALAYILSFGCDGLKQVAEDAVLSANYIATKLKDHYYQPFNGRSMHECLFTDKYQKQDGITTLEVAKTLIDLGFHPMTVFFPLVVPGAMLIEPTECESKASIDQFIEAMIWIAEKAKNGGAEELKASPIATPVAKVDEVLAARKPIVRW